MGSGVVIRSTAEWLIVVFVVFALLFETLLHKLEHWVKAKHKHLQAVLQNLYRELMILGVISFAFIMYVFIGEPSDSVKLTFETAHVFLFLFACFHTLIVSIAVGISLHLSKRWKSLEKMDLIKYLDAKEQYRLLAEKRGKRRNWFWKHTFWWLRNPREKLAFDRLHEIMTFTDIRYQFIFSRKLAPDFQFSIFLRRIKFATFIELVENHPVNWIILLCFIFADIIRVKVGGEGDVAHPNFEAWYLISHSIFNMLLVYFLSRKIRKIAWQMSKNPATYYDSIDADTFREELKIAEQNSRSKFNQPSSSSSASSLPTSKPSDAGSVNSTGEGRRDVKKGVSFAPEADIKNLDAVENDEPYQQPSLRHMGPTALNLLEKVKGSSSDAPISLDMTASIPEREVKIREGAAITAFPVDIISVSQQEGDEANGDFTSTLRNSSQKRQKLKKDVLRHLSHHKTTNAAMSETRKNVEMARSLTPSRKYPNWVLKIFPRLGRVASATEALFWFGSHRFYLFCVENALFFTNINASTCIAKLSFLSREVAEYNKSKAKAAIVDNNKSAKFLLHEAVLRAAADSTKEYESVKKPTESMMMLTIALVLSLIALAFTLFKIAGIMKKYIFVLNNANLLPEDIMIETIEHINAANASQDANKDEQEKLVETSSDVCKSEDDDDPADYSALRRKMTTYMARERQDIV